VCEALLAVKTLCLEAAISEHLGDLCILLAVLAKDELTLVVVVFVLATSPVFAAL
jgi:hypothetical protein